MNGEREIIDLRFQWVDEAESDEDWTYAAIACHNSGGFRASIQANINITVSDLIAAQPFENTYDVVDVKGTDFLQVGCSFFPIYFKKVTKFFF